MGEIETTVVPGTSLSTQPWWKSAHSTILLAYKRKGIQAFPPTWLRLNPDPALGAEGLARELGPKGELVVLLEGERVVACGGLEPFRGADWFNEVNLTPTAKVTNGEVTSHTAGSLQNGLAIEAPITEWEVCSFCVHPDYRGHGLARKLLEKMVGQVASKHGKKLIANYSQEETGNFWPKMGFNEPIGKGSVLKKGFTHTVGMEGLREDLHFKMTARVVS